MGTHARLLAEWLVAQEDSALTDLFQRRGVSPDATWHDFFDAAEHLLDPAAIDRFLPKLSRDEAFALQTLALAERDEGEASVSIDALRALALVRPDGAVVAEVIESVSSRPMVAPRTREAQSGSSSPADAAHAAERAFTTVAALADVILAARESPLALLSTGSISAGERRRLLERGGIAEPEDVDALLAMGVDAGLLRPVERQLRVTTTGVEWLHRAGVGRWVALAKSFRERLPAGITSGEHPWIHDSEWAQSYPWSEGWPETAAQLRRRAELLGLLTPSGNTEWTQLLSTDAEAAGEALRALLPSEVDRIFLQNDLTAIAPGPLVPERDLRLRSMARRESLSQASSYRFTAESIAGAFAEGESAESLTAFLQEISLTGVPQPLQYLIVQAAQRHGMIRVARDAESGRTRVEALDPHLLDAMSVDQTLRPLGLTREDGALYTRVGRDTVFWALTDARYPATALDEQGKDTRAVRSITVDSAPPATQLDFAPLIAQLRAARGPDADAAWLERELESAVRRRIALIVEVGLPDGTTRELTLEVTGLGGGRLRGRDRAADVERTLPVRSILSTRLADED